MANAAAAPRLGSHTVINNIPFTNQTDPRMFPPYEKRDYPKMMTRVCTQADLDAWLERNGNVDDNGKIKYPGGRPRVGISVVSFLDDIGQPIVVNDPEEEAEFRAEHPDASNPEGEQTSLRDENAELRAKMAEMQAKLDAATGKRVKSKVDDEEEQDPPAKDEPDKPTNALSGLERRKKEMEDKKKAAAKLNLPKDL